ncbi:hypothetical protein [Pseudoduganella aquatica]|uniref:Uncharacterized protein n=1 Tax=Pseudoduganella aquatica TaxID=2660641 RepID=A0A7X4KMU8_9BURK|nr:hypothetical protein [Pseudoduganella aquatica]MYN08533.1 hypothetical protein [Pseudoduganella aquatica]
MTITLVHAAVPADRWRSLHGASYIIHGGSLADQQTPTANDKKLSLVIDGAPAREIFNSIGPDLSETCSDEKGDRARIKKGVSCTFTTKDKGAKEGPYRCWIGINLKTGDSVATMSC